MDNHKLTADKDTVAFDVEGTLTEGMAWEGVRAYLVEQGEEARYKAFQKRMTPRYLLYRLNLGDRQAFKEDWVAGILALLAGRGSEELHVLGRYIVEKVLWPQRREDVVAELQAHQTTGRQIVLVSGQFQPFLDAFVEQVGADAGIGTAGEWQNGLFTGNLILPFTIGEQKVKRLTESLNGSPLYAAYGDTGPDAPMLRMSEQPMAVYPDTNLLRAAKENGWRVMG